MLELEWEAARTSKTTPETFTNKTKREKNKPKKVVRIDVVLMKRNI